MQYADNLCTYVELNNPHRYKFTGKCIKCKNQISVEIPGPELYSYRKGNLIQNALKSVSSDSREFLMSGICGTCFDKMFKDEEA